MNDMMSPSGSIIATGQRRQGLVYYISFLVWPFGVMVDAMRHWRQPWAKNIFWLFCVFFGYTFLVASGEFESADSARYAELLHWYASSDIDFSSLLRSFYSESSAAVDIVQPLLTYLISRATTNPQVLFAAFALIFGYFHSRNLWYVLDKTKGNFSLAVTLFIVVFVLLNPIWNINGFRMWTGAQVFIFGVLPYIFEGKTKMLVWPVLAVFFHFSFVIPLGILFTYVLFKNRPLVYFSLFVITSFVKELDIQALQSYLYFLPSVFQSRVAGYTNADYVESVAMAGQALNWYIPLATKGLNWVIYVYAIYFFLFKRKLLRESKSLMNLFCFSLLFYSIANILSLVPSGGRFLNIGSTLLCVFFISYLSNIQKNDKIVGLTYVSVPLLSLFCLVIIRTGMDFFGFVTIVGNPVFAFLGTESAPFIMEIKKLL
jgi:hypothetical protein